MIMKSLVYILLFMIISGCKTKNPKDVLYSSETLKVEEISENIFKHISYLETDDFGKVSCNGMIYINGDKALIYDTPTDKSASSELIEWIQKKNQMEIVAVIVTHFHVDCLGGLKVFHENNILSYALNSTIELARENNKVLPENGFDKEININLGGAFAMAKYFGPGHTTDNIVGHIPAENTLFGGCLIKARNAKKGNLEDANTAEWAATVQSIKNAYPDIKIVIPGHGDSGGKELLDYTIELFQRN